MYSTECIPPSVLHQVYSTECTSFHHAYTIECTPPSVFDRVYLTECIPPSVFHQVYFTEYTPPSVIHRVYSTECTLPSTLQWVHFTEYTPPSILHQINVFHMYVSSMYHLKTNVLERSFQSDHLSSQSDLLAAIVQATVRVTVLEQLSESNRLPSIHSNDPRATVPRLPSQSYCPTGGGGNGSEGGGVCLGG